MREYSGCYCMMFHWNQIWQCVRRLIFLIPFCRNLECLATGSKELIPFSLLHVYTK